MTNIDGRIRRLKNSPQPQSIHTELLSPKGNNAQLDLFQKYLLIINAVAFVLYTTDYWLYQFTGDEKINHIFLDFLTVVGGTVGTLLAFFIWDRKTVKNNAWWHVFAIAFFIIWCVVVGFVYLTPFDLGVFFQNLISGHAVLCIYLVAINVIALVYFGVDKIRAEQGRWRIREITLLGLSLAGGTIGGLIAMYAFRHKIRSPQFKYGLPLMLVAQVVLLVFLINAGVV